MFGHEYEFTTPLHTRNSIQENHNYQKLVVSLMVQKKQKKEMDYRTNFTNVNASIQFNNKQNI